MQEWEQVTVAAPAQTVIVKSSELIDELQMLQLVPAADFTAFLTLTQVRVAHFNSVQVAQDAENRCLVWSGIVSYKLHWLTGAHAAVDAHG